MRPRIAALAPGAIVLVAAACASAGAEDAARYAAVRFVDHEGKVSYEVVRLPTWHSTKEINERKAALDGPYKAALDAWRKDQQEAMKAGRRFEDPKPERPEVKVLGKYETEKEALDRIEAERREDKAKADPGKAARQKILRERLLDHFFMGVDAPLEWIRETQTRNRAMWDARGGYLSGSAKPGETGDDQWFFKYGHCADMLKRAKETNVVLWWTWYTLAASAPAFYKPGPAQATPVNARDRETMRSYFEIFKRLMKMCGEHPEQPIVIQIEPDEWGHLLLSAGMDPLKVNVKVGSTGMEELAGLPDDLTGWAKAFKRLRDRYAPMNVLLGVNPSGWDWRGSMTPEKWARCLEPCGVFEWELAVFETGDRDKGMHGKAPPYGEESGICGTFDNHIGWIDGFHKATGLWVVVWQAAVGNTYFRTCNNTPEHYCDNLAQKLLEGYPENNTIERYAKAGCAGWVWLRGQGESTSVYDDAKDGVTNPEPIPGNQGHVSEYPDDDGGFMRLFGAKYYERPYPILGKLPHPLAAKRGEKAKPGGDGEGEGAKPLVAKAPETRKASPETVAEWDARLARRIAREIEKGGKPGFFLASMHINVKVERASGDGKLALKDSRSGLRLDMTMEKLSAKEKKSLILGVLKDDEADHALAAFYLLVLGETPQAEEHLAGAGALAEAVREAFK